MSFILDALKKSEAERNRQSGPTLIDMRIAPPRRRLPVWLIALTVVLLANLAVLAIVLLRSPTPSQAPSATSALPTAPATQPTAAVLLPAAPPANTNALPPPVLGETPPPAATGLLPAAAELPAGTATAPSVASAGAPLRDDVSGLPSAEDLRIAGIQLPELNLALHAYDANPANRYVLLNSQRLREGESTGTGIRLERITESGAVLVWGGRRFTLSPGE